MASIWREKNGEETRRPQLTGDMETETAIIGGGLTGVLLAYRLRERGIACCVLEADAVGSGTTGGSTGKVTAQHGLLYAKLFSEFGRTKAKEYAQSNAAAVEEYAYLVEKEGIACDFTRCSAYVYSRDGMAALRDEAEAARRLGLNAVLSEVTKLPFPVDGALCFPDQARFDPLAFARGLAKRAEKMGATIFEQTRVTGVEDMRVLTAEGTMQAKHVVFACHYPIINIPGYYFLRMSQQRSFAIALRGAPPLSGAYIDAQQGALSFRGARFQDADALILAAYDVRSGKIPPVESTGSCFVLRANSIRSASSLPNGLHRIAARRTKCLISASIVRKPQTGMLQQGSINGALQMQWLQRRALRQ